MFYKWNHRHHISFPPKSFLHFPTFTWVKELSLYFSHRLFFLSARIQNFYLGTDREYLCRPDNNAVIPNASCCLWGDRATVWTVHAQCGLQEELPSCNESRPRPSRIIFYHRRTSPGLQNPPLFPRNWKVNNTRLFKTTLRHTRIMESRSGPGTSDVADIPRPCGSPLSSCAAAWERKWRVAAEPEQVRHQLGIA